MEDRLLAGRRTGAESLCVFFFFCPACAHTGYSWVDYDPKRERRRVVGVAQNWGCDLWVCTR